MMSVPEGCMLAGNWCFQSARSGQPAWTAQVIEESIHVSKTSISPLNSVPPHLGHLSIRGFSILGSIGTQLSWATMTSPQLLQYHTGIGVANNLWRLTTQSQSSARVQSMRRFFM